MINGFVTTCKHQYIVRAMLGYIDGFLYAFETHHIILTQVYNNPQHIMTSYDS